MREKLHLLVNNLSLLGIDTVRADVVISSRTFTKLENNKRAFEVVSYHLFRIIDAQRCRDCFARLYPCDDNLRAKEYRNAAYKWLCELKKERLLGAVTVRRSLLDDCAGERYEDLLFVLSTMAFLLQARAPKEIWLTGSPPYPSHSLHELRVVGAVQRYCLGNLFLERRHAREMYASFRCRLDELSSLPVCNGSEPRLSNARGAGVTQILIDKELERVAKISSSSAWLALIMPSPPALDPIFLDLPWRPRRVDRETEEKRKEIKRQIESLVQRNQVYARAVERRSLPMIAKHMIGPSGERPRISASLYHDEPEFQETVVFDVLHRLKVELDILEPESVTYTTSADDTELLAKFRRNTAMKPKPSLLPRRKQLLESHTPRRKIDLLRTALQNRNTRNGSTPTKSSPPVTPVRQPTLSSTSTAKTIGRLIDLLNNSDDSRNYTPTAGGGGANKGNSASIPYRQTINRSLEQSFSLWDTSD